ncbi:MAG TPA: DUF3617 family protein [Caulobacteraceae bacterium]|nr:DUF3617 family protein [Caulobacteraceae bacterium]
MRTATVIGLSVLCFVAACGKPVERAGAVGPGAAKAPANGPDAPLAYADLPRLKPGLWRTTTDSGEGPPDTSSSCLSGRAPVVAKIPDGCAQPSIKRTFTGEIVVDASCKTAHFSMIGHTVSRGDFQSHVTTDSETTMTIGRQPPRTSKLHIDSRWVGPCPPGRKPDDAPDSDATD